MVRKTWWSRLLAMTRRPWWARVLAVTRVVVIGAAVLGAAYWLIWRAPTVLYGYLDKTKDADRVARATAEASTRTGFVTGLLGLAALGGLVMTARTYRLT